MTTTRIICGSTHGAWDEWGAHCSICHPARCTCADEGARYSTIRCPVHGAAVTYTPDPRDAEIARLRVALAALRVTADEAIVEHLVARKEVERLREYERLHGTRSNEIGKLRAALAAGPAALRKFAGGDVYARSAWEEVEAAQEAALKGGG